MAKSIIEFPECWEEITTREWVYLLKLRQMLIVLNGKADLIDIKRMWCRYVLKSRGVSSFRRSTDFNILTDRLASTLDWQWRVTDNVIELTFDSTVNLLPSWHIYHGPASHGADMMFGEFRYAVTQMNDFTQNNDIAALNNLCAVLYREVDYNGERIPFTQSVMRDNADRFNAMPVYLRWGVYAWFASFCKFLQDGVFVIDGQEITFAPLFKGGSGNGDAVGSQSLGLNSILFSVAETGVFGSIDDVDNTQLVRVLLKLLDDKQKADSLLKSIKQK